MKDMMPNTKEKIYGAEYVTRQVTVSGRVNQPLVLTVDDLRKMEGAEVAGLTMICGTGRKKGVIDSYRGVLLSAVLDRADIILREHHSPNWTYVTLASSDGHWALFSWHEIFNSPVGERAVVVFERNGLPLDEKEGEIGFISGNDGRTGPRRLRYLRHIGVHELARPEE
ncbi:molybdopterin-dependent oxidoreductase [Geobacter sp. FeAm09]|uniref:molybdopterin-dependent oxidoreductase n=1 Tax=Geobacter sp. FeAm09 TaxID=2597769 RepID=UPI00143D4837|nr:molybdopterin-dependent oxidoreductase [Geobacter sp. FeAm09]